MKLTYSAASPYVRKVMVTAMEIGLADKLERLSLPSTPIATNPDLAQLNPIGKVPVLVTDDGTVLFDSPVICEYLDSLAGGKLYPSTGAARWRVLRHQALADGLLDAALLARYETTLRPEALRWDEWSAGQKGKIARALDALESEADGLPSTVDGGTIGIGCALGYLDFRFSNEDWRKSHPKLASWYATFAARPSMQATDPVKNAA